jgi:large subunit ribosomal protein L14
MAFKFTKLIVHDNTGVKQVKCIHVYNKKQIMKPGSIILVSIKKVIPFKKIKKGQIYRALVVRLNKKINRLSGISLRYLTNSVIILKKNELIPLGTRIFGSIYYEIRIKGYMKIIMLSLFLL